MDVDHIHEWIDVLRTIAHRHGLNSLMRGRHADSQIVLDLSERQSHLSGPRGECLENAQVNVELDSFC